MTKKTSEPAQQEPEMVSCLACGSQHKDGDVQAEFIGWHGQCVVCMTALE